MAHSLEENEIGMLRAELEMLMKERQSLLRIAGAASVFVAELDPGTLPEETLEAAELLAECINAAADETIRDALDMVQAVIVDEAAASSS